MSSLFRYLHRHALYFSWLIALVGFCMSVFYGEILGNFPCPLCWYQRIALFPLVILLGMAAYRGELLIIPYALPIVFLGGIVALFHALQPYVALFQKAGICKFGTPCTHEGFTLVFPFLSALGFFLIAALLLMLKKSNKH